MPGAFQRARKPAEKAQRRDQILATARAMLAESLDSSTLSLNGLAREAGMAKSNVYRYFESREAVLMEVLAAEWLEWHTRLVASLEAGEAPLNDEHLAARLARSMVERPTLCHLVSVLPSVLEKNADVERVAAFKLAGLQLSRAMAAALHEAAPQHSAEQYAELLRHAVVYIIGLWPLSNPPPHIAALKGRPPFCEMAHDFEADLTRAARLLLAGMAST